MEFYLKHYRRDKAPTFETDGPFHRVACDVAEELLKGNSWFFHGVLGASAEKTFDRWIKPKRSRFRHSVTRTISAGVQEAAAQTKAPLKSIGLQLNPTYKHDRTFCFDAFAYTTFDKNSAFQPLG